jgi:hypothetical protein
MDQSEEAKECSMNVQDTLDERQHTHGDFAENARVMQAMKEVARSGVSWKHLTPVQREALEMIIHKVGRIVTGNPDVPDHWLDIEGYARLVRDRLDELRELLTGEPT